MAPDVSIVILNWNGRKYLEQFLPSVLSSTYAPVKIVVADNASTDDSVDFVRQTFPSVKIISLPENFGFARGYNEALKQVDATYFVLLNSDVEVTPGWIDPVIALMEADKKIGACQPKLLLYAKRDQFEYSGAAGGWIDSLGYPFARGRVFDEHEVDRGQYDTTEAVFWASGAAMFVRAEAFRAVGGFDDFFFAHQEEIDLCWRLHRNGYSVYCCPRSVVYHVGGGTLPKGNSRKVFLNFRNNLVMMAKNMPAGEALWKIAYRFILDLVSAVKSLAQGEGRYFTSVIAAHWAFLRWLFSKRNGHGRVGKGSKELGGYYRGSIVWAHFVRGKKKFSEIVGKER